MKPIEGMETTPMGMPLMAGAWIGLLSWALTKEEIVESFKAETGYDIMDVLNSRGINRAIDEATGHTKAAAIAWADYVTRNLWGEEEAVA
jgi:hypothetical protein